MINSSCHGPALPPRANGRGEARIRSPHRVHRSLSWLSVVLLAGQLAACSRAQGATPVAGQPLVTFSAFAPWPDSISMCFINSPRKCTEEEKTNGCKDNTRDRNRPLIPLASTPPPPGAPKQVTYTEAKELVREALLETWASASALRFVDEGDCGPNVTRQHSDWLVIRLRNAGWGGTCGSGVGADCDFGVVDRGRIQDVAVHEIGHALGFQHEHARHDGQACKNVRDELRACRGCLSSAPCRSGGGNACFCASAKENMLCVGSTLHRLTDAEIGHAESRIDDLGGPIPPTRKAARDEWDACRDCLREAPCRSTDSKACFCTDSEKQKLCVGGFIHALTDPEIGHAEARVSDLDGAIGRYLTGYDPGSIMSYCSNSANGGVRVYSNDDPLASDWRLTSLDELGAEILYPTARTLGIACTGGPCFNTSSGVVALDGGMFSSEWVARGGYVPMTSSSRVYGPLEKPYFKSRDFANDASIQAVAAGGIGDKLRSVSGKVRKSTGLFVAILSTVAGY